MAWSVLQSASAQGGSGLTVTFTTANCTAGTKLIAAVAGDNSSLTTVSSVKDAAGNAMTSLGTVTLSDGTGTLTLLAMDTPAVDVGTKPTFTVTMSVGGGSCAMLVQEVSGLLAGNTTAMIDGTAGTNAVNSSGPATSGTYSSSLANEYLVFLYGDSGNNITYTAPSSPWTGDPNGVNTSFNNDCTISYNNSAGTGESASYTINGGVNWGTILVAFNIPSAGPSITTTSLPTAEIGYAYSTTVTATGGTLPYTWSISSGSLPGWASLGSSTGIISGTPTGSPSTTSFTVEVTDNASLTGTKALSITTFNPVAATVPTFPAIPGLSTPGASTPGDPGPAPGAPSTGPVFYPAVQAIRARLPVAPLGMRAFKGRVASSSGAPVKNPAPGPVFKQRTTPVRFIIPPTAPRGRIGTSFTLTVQLPVHGPPLYPLQEPVRARLPQEPVLRGRSASSPGAPVRNPSAGPVFVQANHALRAKLPLQPLLRGRVSFNAGTVKNPASGPVFTQKTFPAKARTPLPARGRVYHSALLPAVIPPKPAPLYPLTSPVRAKLPLQPLLRGRMASLWGAPVQNPQPGPQFTQATSPSHIRASLPPRGRIASNKGVAVHIPGAAPFISRTFPARARFPLPLRGRIISGKGAPVHNPQNGPVFIQKTSPVRVHLVLPPRGRISFNAGIPVPAPVTPAAFQPRTFIRAQLPLPRRGVCRTIKGYPQQVNPTTGPVFYPATSPIRARLPELQLPAGRVGSNKGAPVSNPVPPTPGPVFTQRTSPVQAKQPLPLRGKARYIRLTPIGGQPTPGPVLYPLTGPVRSAGIQLPPRGRVATPSPGGPVRNPVPGIPGPPFFPRNTALRAALPLPRRGTCRTVKAYPGIVNPTSGPVFTQKTSPVQARFPLPPKGRVYSNAGAPVRNPSPGPVFRQATAPVRIRVTLPPRGRIAFNKGAPLANVTMGSVFIQKPFPARARIPQTAPRGRIYSHPGAPVRNPQPGPVFVQAVHPAQARIPQVWSKGRVYFNPGAPVQNPVTPAPLYPWHGPVRIRITLSPRGRIASNPGTLPPIPAVPAKVYPLAGPVRIHPQLPPHGRIISGRGGPVLNPPVPPPVYPLEHPVQARFPLPPRGRIAFNTGAPVHNPPPPVYPLHGPVRAAQPLPHRGRIGSNQGTPPVPPTPGPKVYPLKGPVQARRPLPPRGRVTIGNKGAPVRNPAPGPVFRQAVHPIRAVIPQIAPRGRTNSNPGGPIMNPSGSRAAVWNAGQTLTRWRTGHAVQSDGSWGSLIPGRSAPEER